MSFGIYETVSNRIIAELEAGAIPWTQPQKLRKGPRRGLETVEIRFAEDFIRLTEFADLTLKRLQPFRHPSANVGARAVCSKTSRTARACASGENLLVVLLAIAPRSQGSEPPASPERFIAA